MKIKIILFLCIFIIISCQNKNKTNIDIETTIDKNELLEWNKKIVDINTEVINKFLERRKWKMEISETGLYWQIIKKTNLQKIVSGKIVEFKFKTFLLSGELLYSSEISGNRFLQIDKNQEEVGLNEGLKMLCLGEKARFIIPPHLAFGVAGDGYKVPVYAVLLYEVEIVEINDANVSKNIFFDDDE